MMASCPTSTGHARPAILRISANMASGFVAHGLVLFDGGLRSVDAYIEPETLVAVGRAPAFPDELPGIADHRTRGAEVLAVLAQQHVAVVAERKMHIPEISE